MPGKGSSPGTRRIEGHGHQAQILLGLQEGQGLGLEGRADDAFHEGGADALGHALGDGAVAGHDAAEGRHAVRVKGLLVGQGDVLALVEPGHAAGIGVLDDGHGRLAELLDHVEGRVQVGDVVVAELLAVQLLGRAHVGPALACVHVKGGVLMRVFPVAQILGFGEECRFSSAGKAGSPCSLYCR